VQCGWVGGLAGWLLLEPQQATPAPAAALGTPGAPGGTCSQHTRHHMFLNLAGWPEDDWCCCCCLVLLQATPAPAAALGTPDAPGGTCSKQARQYISNKLVGWPEDK
jgi:hypothetical protein